MECALSRYFRVRIHCWWLLSVAGEIIQRLCSSGNRVLGGPRPLPPQAPHRCQSVLCGWQECTLAEAPWMLSNHRGSLVSIVFYDVCASFLKDFLGYARESRWHL